jgi:PIN domain nuclease of toxin-antitoxin system
LVLDASALLVLLNDEPGVHRLPSGAELLQGAVMSTVNLAEAQGKLVSRGVPPTTAWEALLAPIYKAYVLDEEQAKLIGDLAPRTRDLSLSLGDRACLALEMTLKVPIYTADRQWSRLNLGVAVHVIR